MFYIEQQYTLNVKETPNGEIYMVSLNNSEENTSVEVTKEVAEVIFSEFVKKERNLVRSDERNLTNFFDDERLKEQQDPSVFVEEEILSQELLTQLYVNMDKLPKIQRRRVELYYFKGMTLEEIAKIEGCSFRAVNYSLEFALTNLKKFFKHF